MSKPTQPGDDRPNLPHEIDPGRSTEVPQPEKEITPDERMPEPEFPSPEVPLEKPLSDVSPENMPLEERDA